MPRLRWWILLSLVGVLLVLVRVFDVHLALVGGVIAMSDSIIGMREVVLQTADQLHEQQSKDGVHTLPMSTKRSHVTILGIYC
jgi:hypothetical protein